MHEVVSRMSVNNYRMLTMADGGSLVALKKKGNLSHVELLYNPNNFFEETHILVINKEDLQISLTNPTLKVHYLKHLPGKLGLILSLPYMLFQVKKIIKRNKINVLRARNAYLAGLICNLAGKFTKTPVVVSLGGDNRLVQQLMGHYYLGSRYLSYRLEEFSIRSANLIFSVNEFTSAYAMKLGALTNRIRLVPHRIDINLSDYAYDMKQARTELGYGDEPLIVMVGRLERDKQVDTVVESIPFIHQKNPSAKFIFVGDGSSRSYLEERVHKFGLQHFVEFVGFKERKEVIKYLAAANLVWIPMSGFVVYEAAAAKKAIITYDVEWHSEFIRHKETGLLVQNRNSQKLGAAVIELLEDPALAERLAQNAYKKLCEEYDRESIINKEINAYKELLPC